MRALLMAVVLAIATPALADPTPMYVRAMPAHVETPAPREQKPVVLTVTMRETDETRLPERAKHPGRLSLMEQLRDRIVDELPVVSTAIVVPLPISTADGTLAGFGVLGTF
jgi:hypothetical protein